MRPGAPPPGGHHTVAVPATTANLGPGFDAFGLALDRHLAVRTVPRRPDAGRVVSRAEDAHELPDGDDNLVWRAFVGGCEALDADAPDVGLEVTSEIPLQRGLGSSAAAIVAGVVLARALTGAVISDRGLVGIAADLEGHPDNVAAALLGGLVVCAPDDDERWVVRRINPAAHLRPLLLVPDTRSVTTAARAVLPETLSRSEVAAQAARAGHVVGAVAGLWSAEAGLVGDRLHEPARLDVMPASARVLGALRTEGVHAWLSGAGPSIATLMPAGDEDAQASARRVAAAHGFETWSLDVELSGALVCPDDGCAISGVGGCVQCPRERV